MSRLIRETVTIRGEDFIVREWTPAERSAAFKTRESDVSAFPAAVAYSCTIKEDGKRFFASLDAVQQEPAAIVDELCAAALRLSGVLDQDEEKND